MISRLSKNIFPRLSHSRPFSLSIVDVPSPQYPLEQSKVLPYDTIVDYRKKYLSPSLHP